MSADMNVNESVDLTEDEQSSEESPDRAQLQFVPCSKVKKLPPLLRKTVPFTTPIKKTVPNIFKKQSSMLLQETINARLNASPGNASSNAIGKFHSVQVKPPCAVPEVQNSAQATKRNNTETVCLDSDEEPSNTAPPSLPIQNSVPQTFDPIYPPRQPSKVVIIKKNNKYYKIIIPYNVMPDVNKSIGPVLINIPEVGPLVITSDPSVNKQNILPVRQLPQQILNLDAVGVEHAGTLQNSNLKGGTVSRHSDKQVLASPNINNMKMIIQNKVVNSTTNQPFMSTFARVEQTEQTSAGTPTHGNLKSIEVASTDKCQSAESYALQRAFKEQFLCDKKYCWTYVRNRKRDLDGFTMNDRLGFTKAETNRAKICWWTLDSLFIKKKKLFINVMHEYNKFKESLKEKQMVKFVKINEIVEGTQGKSLYKKEIDLVQDEPELISDVSEAEQNDYDSDLLVTKKVVILTDNNKEIEIKNKRGGKTNPKAVKKKLAKEERIALFKERIKKTRETKNWGGYKKATMKSEIKKPNSIRPCFVLMKRDPGVERLYKKLCKNKFFCETYNINLPITRKPRKALHNKLIKDVSATKYKSKIANKIKTEQTVTTKSLQKPSDSTAHNPLQKFVSKDLKEQIKQDRFFQHIKTVLFQRVIETEVDFRREVNFFKPMLIVNMQNMFMLNYSQEFSKSNIMYVVQDKKNFPSQVLTNGDFISAVELGYVKLVTSDLFCKYMGGGMN